MPIIPATLNFTADGTPFSESFGDVYHSSDGGMGQAQHVFLAGNGVPERWQDRRQFVIVETGFGLGLNFLATWTAWRADARRSERLHFISYELHPFRREALTLLHKRWPELAPLAEELQAAWPALVPGTHRLNLDKGRVCLTLYFGDAADGLERLVARADAFMLDGFSPAKNTELWSQRLFHLLARIAAPGATLATWSVAGGVREGLRRAGFDIEKVPGFGAKRDMLRGCIARAKPYEQHEPAGHAVVIGAGMAGTSIANRLAERGWRIDIIDSASAPGQRASGNIAGVLRPLPSLDDNRLSRLTRAGSLYGLHHLRRIEKQGLHMRWEACGALHLGRDAEQEEKQRRVVEKHAYPDDFLQYVDREQAAQIAQWPVAHGGWWFPQGAWAHPAGFCAVNLAAWPQHIHAHFNRAMHRLSADDNGWHALDADGQTIASAPVVILANGTGIVDVPEAAALPVRSARGQVAHLFGEAGSAPNVVVCCTGYVSPVVNGLRCAGATFSVDDEEAGLRLEDHQENLDKLDFILPGFSNTLTDTGMSGRVGFRPASPDRLPMVGAVPCWPTAVDAQSTLANIARHPGLYAVSGFGARGLVWASLVAESLACQLNGEPLPLERDIVDAIDPARYLLRMRKHRHAAHPARQRTPEDDGAFE